MAGVDKSTSRLACSPNSRRSRSAALRSPIPSPTSRGAAALAKVRRGSDAPGPGGVLEQIFVRDGARSWFVRAPGRVSLLTSEGNYVRLSWGTHKPLLGRALANLEQRVDPRRFFRANRRQIINLDFIASVELGIGGRLHVQLRDGPEVEISRRPARLFKMRLNV